MQDLVKNVVNVHAVAVADNWNDLIPKIGFSTNNLLYNILYSDFICGDKYPTHSSPLLLSLKARGHRINLNKLSCDSCHDIEMTFYF